MSVRKGVICLDDRVSAASYIIPQQGNVKRYKFCFLRYTEKSGKSLGLREKPSRSCDRNTTAATHAFTQKPLAGSLTSACVTQRTQLGACSLAPAKNKNERIMGNNRSYKVVQRMGAHPSPLYHADISL